MGGVTVRVEAEVHPTEVEEKVNAAIANVFGNLSIETEPLVIGSQLIGTGKGLEALENFRTVLRRDRVRSAARKLLHSSVRGNCINFCLNKQVAFAGHVSFSQETGECPLGPIKVIIKTESPRELVDWLAPRITET
jgi:predicted RNA binding protein with dsRBD fold (UPF0201 family)